MKLSSLEEKYNKSRKLGYVPRRGDTLYPSFGENRPRKIMNTQSLKDVHLGSLTRENDRLLKGKYFLENERRGKVGQEKEYVNPIRNPIKEYKNNVHENRTKLHNIYDSPIKSLPIPTFTPTRIKPHSIYKTLDTPTSSGSISRYSKKKNKVHKPNKDTSKDSSLFSKLRNYLNNFSLTNIESSDSNLQDLRLSAKKFLDLPESKKIEKKVSFEDNTLYREKNNYKNSPKMHKNMDSFESNADEVDEIIKEYRRSDVEVAHKLRDQLDDLNKKYKDEVISLNEVIHNLKVEYNNAIEEGKVKEKMLEEQYDKSYKNIIAKHEEKQKELEATKKEIERERLILNKKEIEIENKLEEMNSLSLNKMIKRNLDLNKQFYQNEYSDLLQHRLSTRLKIEQNIGDYNRVCKKLKITLPLGTARNPNSKYNIIIEKFKEYSRLLELPEFYKSLDLSEIEDLFNKLKQSLLTSSFRKRLKLEKLEEDILNIVVNYERQLCSSYDVSRVFSRKNNLLLDLDLIYNLLIDLNSLFSQLNELLVQQDFNSGAFYLPNNISRF